MSFRCQLYTGLSLSLSADLFDDSRCPPSAARRLILLGPFDGHAHCPHHIAASHENMELGDLNMNWLIDNVQQSVRNGP